MPVTPFADDEARFRAGRLGMRLFLISLGTLFAASLLGFVVIRAQAGTKWPSDLPPLPRILWLSTCVLLASSGTVQAALESARRGRRSGVKAGMVATLVLGVAFLCLQSAAWLVWLEPVSKRWQSSEVRYALSGFYVLTALHALHVIGGLVPMAIVTFRAWFGCHDRGPHSRNPAMGVPLQQHAGVHYITMYWHFLDAVWLALFISLMLEL